MLSDVGPGGHLVVSLASAHRPDYLLGGDQELCKAGSLTSPAEAGAFPLDVFLGQKNVF